MPLATMEFTRSFDTSKKIPMVTLTGGPCGGKSSSLDSLKITLHDAGYDVFTVPEANTILVSNGATFPGFDESKRSELLQYEINLMQLLFDMERAIQSVAAIGAKKPVIICDRGAMDIRAYLPDDLWEQLLQRMGLTEQSLLDRYDLVLLPLLLLPLLLLEIAALNYCK